ncbi:MAG: hypothetical protein U0414_27435 [Polyangiaceae bacterium]
MFVAGCASSKGVERESAGDRSPATSPAPRISRGPIVVNGYPTNVGSGFAAVATYAGFTRDGRELGLCWSDGASDEMHCRFEDRAGGARGFDAPLATQFTIASGEVATWLAAQGIRPFERMKGPDAAAWDSLPPPLVGEWKHPEITLEVRETPPVVAPGGVATTPPRLELGGSMPGRAPFFPYVFEPADDPLDAHYMQAVLLALSPDGTELGLITQSPRGEYDTSFVIRRIPLDDLGARIKFRRPCCR